jgi:hypothetical protein
MEKTTTNRLGQLAENITTFTLLQSLIKAIQDPEFCRDEVMEITAMKQIFSLNMCGEA